MQRTITTTADEDAAIAWHVAQMALTTKDPITEAAFIAAAAHEALHPLVVAYVEYESRLIGDAAKTGTVAQRTAAKTALGVTERRG